jgi:hypothetical protein
MTAAWDFICAVEAVGKTAEGPHFQRTVMRLLTQKLLQVVRSERPIVVECSAELGFPPFLPVKGVPVRFQIGDWALVAAVERMARNEVLQAEPVKLCETNGLFTQGIRAVHKNRPVMTLTASRELANLFVRVGGFDRSFELRVRA